MNAPKKAPDGSFYTNVYDLKCWHYLHSCGLEPTPLSRREVTQRAKNDRKVLDDAIKKVLDARGYVVINKRAGTS